MAISIFETSNFVKDDFSYREIVSYKRATDASQQLLSVHLAFFCFLSSLFSSLKLLEQPYLATTTVIPLSPTQCLLVMCTFIIPESFVS